MRLFGWEEFDKFMEAIKVERDSGLKFDITYENILELLCC
jgi:hypothetical protein